MTVLDLIKRAFRDLNIYSVDDDIPSSEANESFDRLNMMLNQWNNQQLLCYQIAETSWPVVSNKATYSIGKGAGADWNGDRPIRISSIYLRLNAAPNSIDYPLVKLTNEQYQDLSMKAIQSSIPYAYLFVNAWPNAIITLFPVPTTALTLYLHAWSQLAQFSTINDTVSLPPGYDAAIIHNLAVEIASYHNPPETLYQRVLKMATDSKAILKDTNNSEPVMAKVDFAMAGRPTGYPNILTG